MGETLNIGIFGGSFDPVHMGHVCLAQDAIEQADLDELVFVPAYIQPFKQDKKATSGQTRVEMLRLASEGDERMSVSDYELKQEGVSYTYLTLRYMTELYGAKAAQCGKPLKIFFLCGTDSFINLEKWANAEELLHKYSFIIGSRPGYKQMELQETMDRVKSVYGTEAINIHNRLRNISATEIREKVHTGEDVSDLIPQKVAEYIIENNLYR